MKKKIIATKIRFSNKLRESMQRTNKGFDGVVVVIGLCLIVIIVLVLFRSQMTSAISGLITDLKTKLTNLGTAL